MAIVAATGARPASAAGSRAANSVTRPSAGRGEPVEEGRLLGVRRAVQTQQHETARAVLHRSHLFRDQRVARFVGRPEIRGTESHEDQQRRRNQYERARTRRREQCEISGHAWNLAQLRRVRTRLRVPPSRSNCYASRHSMRSALARRAPSSVPQRRRVALGLVAVIAIAWAIPGPVVAHVARQEPLLLGRYARGISRRSRSARWCWAS
jgi:hypothetical protein